METVRTIEKSDVSLNKMEIIFSALDQAIDDMENGRVLTEDELWAEIDTI